MIDRRAFILGSAALGLAIGCTPATGAVTLAATGSSGMNPGPDGSDRPLTLQILQLRSAGAFDGADFFALQNPAGALGGDLVKAEQMVLSPGATASKTIGLDPATTVVAVVAGFRDPAGKSFRAKTSVSPTAKVAFRVEVGAGGIALVPA